MHEEKAKAKQLVDKMETASGEESTRIAKQCAIIAVDEILMNIDATALYHKESISIPINREYWIEVKEAIIKL